MIPGVLCGITSALWYPYLLPKLVPGDNVFLKTLLDLVVYSPIMGTAVFVLNPLLAGHVWLPATICRLITTIITPFASSISGSQY